MSGGAQGLPRSRDVRASVARIDTTLSDSAAACSGTARAMQKACESACCGRLVARQPWVSGPRAGRARDGGCR